MDEAIVREMIVNALEWKEAHATLDEAVRDVPPAMRGARAGSNPHSLWQLLEHIRIAQRDILEFWRGPDYPDLEWPEDYWPDAPDPPDEAAWFESVEQIYRDRAVLTDMLSDPDFDFTALIPHGNGQTYLREAILVADHTSYHIGQMIGLRKALGCWPS